MNFTELAIFEQAQIKITETFTEVDALDKIKKNIKNKTPYKFFFIDLEDQRINLKWLVDGIREIYKDSSTPIKLVVTLSNNNE
jgi:hypothetical protein